MEPELGKDAVELAQLWDQLALILFFQVRLICSVAHHVVPDVALAGMESFAISPASCACNVADTCCNK